MNESKEGSLESDDDNKAWREQGARCEGKGEKGERRSVDAHTLVGLHGRTVGVTVGDRAEVGELVGGRGLDRGTTLGPVSRADLAVLVLMMIDGTRSV